MDLRLLGPLEVSFDAGPIELGPRKQRAVLAMLALEAGRTVSADRIAEGLWGDQLPPSGSKMVQLYVSHLRRLFAGDGVQIVTRGRGYELQLAGGEVDAVLAERLLGESRPREALALWRGEPLADLADEPFAAAEIRRLDELRLRACEQAIDADLDAGRHAQVIGELDALVAANPLRERLHAQRMLALYRSGRQSEALDAYRDARSRLVDDIGVEPGAKLQRLQESILAQDPALDVEEDAPGSAPAAGPRPPPRRSAHRLLFAAAALLIAGVTAFGIIRVLQPDGLAGIDENAVGLIDPDGGRITTQYAVGKSPVAAVEGGGSVWIANAADGTVSRIDREREEEVRISVDGSPAALAFAGGSLWVADSDSREVAQVDPGTNKVFHRIEVGNAPRALAAVGGAVWVASGVDARIRRIDIKRGRVTETVTVGAVPSAMAAGAGALWVASEEAGTVTRIEPRTGTVVRPIPVGNGPSALATGEGAVWVVNRLDGTLGRIDPETNSVSWSVAVGSDPTGVAAGPAGVWVAGGEEGTVVHVDPDEQRVVRRVPTGSSPSTVALAGGSVWVAADAPHAAHRGGTLRVLFPAARGSLVPIDWLHPDSYTGVETFQTASLAYDGLVAYRRVEGAAGATLVGALATSVPAPSRGGRSYTFTLRRGVRYSDGTPVRPEDFRASMERFLRVTGDRFPPYYSGIVGAPRCVRRPARCDLSRGIETDARARTITIHLTRRDGSFLSALALPFAFVVPAGSPLHATTGRAPPGTGPYRVTAWTAGSDDARGGGTLVRNPHFRANRWRPDGFADRIEVDLRPGDRMESQIADVQRGRADLAVLANPWVSIVSSERLRALVAASPGRIHSNPVPTTDWMFLNVKRPPFDDVRVRRAVNLAIDRERLVTLEGGSAVGQVTCQVVPTAFPGYARHCPSTADPRPDGRWTAPDMERARRLVSESGRAGERVVVHVPEFRRGVGRYYTALLRRLGFPARLRVHPSADYPVYRPGFGAQTGFVGWLADASNPASMFVPSFACVSPGDRNVENLSRVCDRTLDRRIKRALALPAAEASPAWAAADRRVTHLAAVVPMTNRRAAVLVSERAGNVKHHAQWFTLLDQLWVR